MTLAIWEVSADAAIVAIGAGAAALIAALTAQARLRAQLRHDTEMRERDATRDALDAVVTEITAAVGAMNAAAEASDELVPAAQVGGITAAQAAAKVGDAVARLREHRAPLMAASFRLHLRFPDSDPIIGRLADWRNTFTQLAEEYQGGLQSTDPDVANSKGSWRAALIRSRRDPSVLRRLGGVLLRKEPRRIP
jgi:hypothetical protein